MDHRHAAASAAAAEGISPGGFLGSSVNLSLSSRINVYIFSPFLVVLFFFFPFPTCVFFFSTRYIRSVFTRPPRAFRVKDFDPEVLRLLYMLYTCLKEQAEDV